MEEILIHDKNEAYKMHEIKEPQAETAQYRLIGTPC